MKIIKKTVLFIWIAVFIAASFPEVVHAQGKMTYTVEPSVEQGGSITVNIAIDQQATVDAVQLYLEYDPQSFELDEAASWMLDQNMAFNDQYHSISNFIQSSSKAVVSLVHWQEQVTTDSAGSIASIKFKAKEDAPAAPAMINLTYSSTNVAPFVSTLEHGKIVESEPDPMKVEIIATKPSAPRDDFLPPNPIPDRNRIDDKPGVPLKPGIRTRGDNGRPAGRIADEKNPKSVTVIQPVAPVPDEGEEEDEPKRVKSKSGRVLGSSSKKSDKDIDEEADKELKDEKENLGDEKLEKADRAAVKTSNGKLLNEFGEELAIPSSPLSKHRIPEGFGAQTLTVHGFDIQGYSSKEYDMVLYYLQAPNRAAELYTYNQEFDTFELFDLLDLQPQNADDTKVNADVEKPARSKAFDAQGDEEEKANPIAVAAVSLVGASSLGVFILSIIKQLRP